MEQTSITDSSDIVEELYDWAYICNESQGKAHVIMLSGFVFEEAAKEIVRLRKIVNQFQHRGV
jgi:hypothetical protein